jgi:thioesterase domain-containing protein
MIPAAEDIAPRLARLWADLLPAGPITPETDFFQAGGHSLLATRMLSRVEKEFGTKVPLPVFFRDATLDALSRTLAAEPPPRSLRFDRIARLGQGQSKPVFAVAHSNGAFFPLGQDFGGRHPFLALQAADRRSGGRLPDSVEELARDYVRQLRSAEPTGPYVVLGWCLAGSVAYEVAQQLRAAGQEVTAVVMVDTWNAAYLAAMRPWRREVAERSYGWQIILTQLGKVLRGRMTLGDFMRRRNAVRRLVPAPDVDQGPTTPAAAAYLADQAFDADLLAQLTILARRYQPKPYDGRVLMIRSSEEPRGFGLDRQNGWGTMVGPGLQMVTVRGDHLSIFMEPAITELTRHVRSIAGLDGEATTR